MAYSKEAYGRVYDGYQVEFEKKVLTTEQLDELEREADNISEEDRLNHLAFISEKFTKTEGNEEHGKV